jgi:hypothetical protein
MIFDDELINKQEFEFDREAVYRKTKIRNPNDSHSLTNDRIISEGSDVSSRN